MSTDAPPPLSKDEKRAALARWGFLVEPDGRVFCRGCGADAVWAADAKAGDWAAVTCSGTPPCSRRQRTRILPS